MQRNVHAMLAFPIAKTANGDYIIQLEIKYGNVKENGDCKQIKISL